jgi:5'/3'-nucleotidase SurE
VLLSGTIGAALHGARNGIPSVAFSVHNSASGGDKAIASVTRAIVKAVPFAGLGRGDVLNVNFPLANHHDCDLHDHPEQPFGLQGIVETKLAPQVTGEDLVAEQRGHRNFYWNRRKTLRDPYGAGVSVDTRTDIGALVAQFVSITVLDGQMRERKDTTLSGKIISQVEAGLGLDG